MKIYDISQEIFGCKVYPGDMEPRKSEDMRICRGDLYNLTSFSMCAHNGTHIDAPFHFIADGDTVEKIPVYKTVGHCYVSDQSEDIDSETAKMIIKTAKDTFDGAQKRILLKGMGVVKEGAARVFADAGTYLLGVEGQSVGPVDAPMAVHKILLETKTVLLEGICLDKVEEGVYFLSAAPLSLGGSDGAPCRAILIEE